MLDAPNPDGAYGDTAPTNVPFENFDQEQDETDHHVASPTAQPDYTGPSTRHYKRGRAAGGASASSSGMTFEQLGNFERKERVNNAMQELVAPQDIEHLKGLDPADEVDAMRLAWFDVSFIPF